MIFGMPATELNNQMPDLITLLGKAGADLEEKMMTAANNHERINIITEFLELRVQKNQQHSHPVISCINSMIHCKSPIRIKQMANQYFISQRQFERKFKEFSGFTPKLFSRILRFQAACGQFSSSKSLTDIAYDSGYYDQSHFIHEFKEFSGHHPKHYFSGRAEGTEWKIN